MVEVTENSGATGEYAQAFYALLKKTATVEEVLPAETDEPNPVLVWRGKLLETFDSLGISNIYYSRIRRIFLKYDCVTYLQRGTKSYDSVLVLNHPPPENLSPEDLTSKPGGATLSAVAEKVEDLEHSVKVLEGWRDSLGGLNIVEALRDMEDRLNRAGLTGGLNGKDKGTQ